MSHFEIHGSDLNPYRPQMILSSKSCREWSQKLCLLTTRENSPQSDRSQEDQTHAAALLKTSPTHKLSQLHLGLKLGLNPKPV